MTVTLSLSTAVYRPAEVTADLVRRALEQHKRRNSRMKDYMVEYRAGMRRNGRAK